jgi:hypothetical protein
LPEDLIAALTKASLMMPEEKMNEGLASLRSALAKLTSKPQTTYVRFGDKALEILQEVGPEKEASILNAIADSGDFKLLEATARQIFPSELITKLPGPVIKTCLNAFPLAKRADFLSALDDEQRIPLLEAIGKEGSKSREMIDAEMLQIAGDDGRKKRALRNRMVFWREFVDLARGLIRRDLAASELADPIIGAWLFEKSGGQVGAQGDNAQVAA